MATQEQTIDDRIKAVSDEIAAKELRLAQLPALIVTRRGDVQRAVDSGNSAEAKKAMSETNAMIAEQGALPGQIAQLKQVLSDLQEQKRIQNQAEAANIEQVQATAALTQSQANLTPEQLFQLQLEQIKGNTEANKAKMLQADKDAAATAQSKKNMIIAAVALTVVVIVGVIIYKISK